MSSLDPSSFIWGAGFGKRSKETELERKLKF